MSEVFKAIRLSKAAREFNVGISTIVEFLSKKGHEISNNPNTKLSEEIYTLLLDEYADEKHVKEESMKREIGGIRRESVTGDQDETTDTKAADVEERPEADELIITGHTSEFIKETTEPAFKSAEETKAKKEAVPEEKPEIKEEIKEEVKEEKKEPIEEKKEEPKEEPKKEAEKAETNGDVKVLGKIDLDKINQKTRPAKKSKKEADKIAEKEEPKKKEEKIKAEKVPEKEEIKAEEVKKEVVAKKEEEKKTEEAPVKGKKEVEKAAKDNFIPTEFKKLTGPKILDKIELPVEKKPTKKPIASSKDEKVTPRKKKRRRIDNVPDKSGSGSKNQQTDRPKPTSKNRPPARGKKRRDIAKPEVSEEEIQKQIKETLSRLSPSGKSKASKHRKLKRAAISQVKAEEEKKLEEDKKFIKVTEFVTVNELATMMDVSVTDVISACMSLGLFVSINQRLDAETLTVVSEEFGYKVEFVSVEVQEAIDSTDEVDDEDDIEERHPIITVMGHVDHGKTKLLDFIRDSNVVAGEAGGITQHIGAYEVMLDDGKKITFLDTPGHEAFTAMRARGAKITDVAIIVVAADDNVMPQTKEAINHAHAANVPIVFAINKIDKPNANPEKIKQVLADMDILVEDWGGKYQSQEISAKNGDNIEQLLEKVLLESELLELKGNSEKLASGTVIESSLDKGRGYVTKILVQNGTLRIGDMVVAGSHFGKVKAMYNERNQTIKEAGPSAPLLMLGLNGAPQAGDGFNVMKDEREAKSIAVKRQQLQREQGYRTQKHITLDEIGRRIAIGEFKELNLIVKGDVDGSVEALSDSLLKLSTKEVQVNVIHGSVGAITETDVMLASASNAIIVGFQVRPSPNARKIAEKEQIDIRQYSIIYQAIEEIKSAIEGMLSPEIEEKITCNIEIRETFKITKVGTIAGCYVLDGKVNRNTKVRVIRDGIVVYTGYLGSLKRFKDDVKEVASGYECGLNIENFNDVKVGDIIEGYEEVEIKRKL